MSVKELLEEIKAAARGKPQLSKTASAIELDHYSEAQLNEAADQLEHRGQKHAAAESIMRMRQENAEAPLSSEDEAALVNQVRKLAYQQAARELGLWKGATGLSPLALLFGSHEQAVTKLAELATDKVSTLLAKAFRLGVNPYVPVEED